jgi:hypothetical protein
MPPAAPAAAPSPLEQKMALEMENAAAAKEVAALEHRGRELTERIAVLTNQNADKRKAVHQGFLDKNQERFKDIDLGSAILGLGGEHVMKIRELAFHLGIPSGETQRQINAFALEPTAIMNQLGGAVKVNLGPVEQHEIYLLQFIRKFQPPVVQGKVMPIRDLTNTPIPNRLEMLRSLPLPLLHKVAEECDAFNAYVNIFLERELGN